MSDSDVKVIIAYEQGLQDGMQRAEDMLRLEFTATGEHLCECCRVYASTTVVVERGLALGLCFDCTTIVRRRLKEEYKKELKVRENRIRQRVTEIQDIAMQGELDCASNERED